MKKINLRYCYIHAGFDHDENRNACEVVKELGIKYEKSVPQSICDQFWFFNCTNVPDNLPPYITPMEVDIKNLVGHGLSAEDVEKLEGK